MSQYQPNQLSEQIALLQQRHNQMVQQTQAEIARLQQEMLLGGQAQQLQQRLAQAETEKQQLQQQLVATHQQYQEQYEQLLRSFTSLKSPAAYTAAPQAAPEPIAPASPSGISFKTVEFAPSTFWSEQPNLAPAQPMLATQPATELAEPQQPQRAERRMLFVFKRRAKKQRPAVDALSTQPVSMSPEVLAALQPQAPTQVDGIKKKTKQPGGFRRIAVRFAVFTLFAAGGFWGWQTYLTPTTEIGNVAGAQNGGSSTPSEQERYKESFADVPFEDTQWETLNDPDLGIKIDWPKNTTNMSRVVGGSNLWFLRKNGYLFRLSIPDSVILPLDEWWDLNRETYLNGATESRVTFKGQPAIRVTPRESTPTSGTSYYFSGKLGIMQVWVKDEPPTTDDGRRLARMVESLTFQ